MPMRFGAIVLQKTAKQVYRKYVEAKVLDTISLVEGTEEGPANAPESVVTVEFDDGTYDEWRWQKVTVKGSPSMYNWVQTENKQLLEAA